MSERGMYLPLTWNDEEKGMGVYLPAGQHHAAGQTREFDVPAYMGPDFEHPLYLVETISVFRMRYVVSAKNADHACDSVVLEEAQELSQKHIDENIVSVREINRLDYRKIFDEDNAYLKDWDLDKKFGMVHVVDYDDCYTGSK